MYAGGMPSPPLHPTSSSPLRPRDNRTPQMRVSYARMMNTSSMIVQKVVIFERLRRSCRVVIECIHSFHNRRYLIEICIPLAYLPLETLFRGNRRGSIIASHRNDRSSKCEPIQTVNFV